MANRANLESLERAELLHLQNGSEGLKVEAALRDSSATILVMCVPSGRLPSPVPSLQVSGRLVHPIGGKLVQMGDRSYTYAYFPSTQETDVQVVQEGRKLARLRFNQEPQDDCALEASRGFELVDCGALTILDWYPAIRLEEGAVETIEGAVFARGKRARSLGFFFSEHKTD